MHLGVQNTYGTTAVSSPLTSDASCSGLHCYTEHTLIIQVYTISRKRCIAFGFSLFTFLHFKERDRKRYNNHGKV